jgi:hypothetical protein
MPFNSNIPLNFAIGLFAGASVFRYEVQKNFDMRAFGVVAISLYTFIRTGGDFNVRLNNALAIAAGVTIAAYTCRALFDEPSASPKPY